MKVSENFILREIAGEYILVPITTSATQFNGLIAFNEIGSFIFHALEEEQTEDSLVEKITEEYDIDADTARADLREFLEKLRQFDALVEE